MLPTPPRKKRQDPLPPDSKGLEAIAEGAAGRDSRSRNDFDTGSKRSGKGYRKSGVKFSRVASGATAPTSILEAISRQRLEAFLP